MGIDVASAGCAAVLDGDGELVSTYPWNFSKTDSEARLGSLARGLRAYIRRFSNPSDITAVIEIPYARQFKVSQFLNQLVGAVKCVLEDEGVAWVGVNAMTVRSGTKVGGSKKGEAKQEIAEWFDKKYPRWAGESQDTKDAALVANWYLKQIRGE